MIKRYFLVLVFLVMGSTVLWGQTTVSWNFGTSSGSASPSSGTPVTNLTVGDISIGNTLGTVTMLSTTSASSGYTGASGNYNAGNAARVGALNTGASGSAYFEFTLTPAAGCSVTISAISFGTRSTSTAPQAYSLRYSTDSYGSDLASGTMSNNSTWVLKTNTSLSISSGLGTAVTFRLYGYNGSGTPTSNTINWRIDDLAITLSMTVTEPTTQADTISFASITTNSMTINWTNGNGSSRAVFMKQGSGTITNPTDGTAYTASSDWSSKGTQLGTSGYYCIYNGTGNSVAVTNLSAGTEYFVQVFEYNGSGATANYLTSTASGNPNSQTTSPASSPTITVAPTSLSGFVYGQGEGPSAQQSFTISGNNLVADIVITPPTNYEISITSGGGFTPENPITLNRSEGSVAETEIYVRLKSGLTSNNYNGEVITASSTDATDKTVTCNGKVLAAQPSSQASSVLISAISSTGMTISWTSGSGDNRIVLVKSGGAVDSNPVDGTSYTANTTFGSGTQIGTGNYVVYNSTSNTVTISGLTGSTTYYVAVYEFSGSSGLENYLTGSPATGNATTLSSASDIVTANNEAGNIDYAAKQASSIASTSDAVRVWSLTIRDGGGSADADAASTELTAITIGKGGSNTVSSWTNTIRQAALFNGPTFIAQISVAAENITFSGLSGADVTAADNGTVTLDLYLTFETAVTDNQQFHFLVTSATANASASTFASANAGGASSSVTGDNNKIEVTATQLIFTASKPPSSVYQNVKFDVEVSAKDGNNRTDLDATNEVTLSRNSGTGSLSSVAGLVKNLSSGVYSWTDVKYNEAESFTIDATASGLTTATSASITSNSWIKADHVVIHEVYGGGGNSGATYTNDYVILFNPTGSSVNLSTWSIQYASATGTFSYSAANNNLSGSIAANSYYSIKMASGGAVGSALPFTENSTNTGINMSATAGKVALVNNQVAITGISDENVIDFVGFGSTANAFEGSSYAPAPSNSSSIRRKAEGFDNNENSIDYYVETDLSTNQPLPVELTSFSAKSVKSGVALSWQTATEVNNYGFEIQRKTSPQPSPYKGEGVEGNWEVVGFVPGNGNSNSEKSYSFTDRNVANATKYIYRLKQIDTDGKFDYSKEVEVTTGMPERFELAQNYPNPFNPSTVISYQLTQNGNVKLTVFDILGNEIATLVNGKMDAGSHTVSFNASGLQSGIYFYKITVTGENGSLLYSSTNKMSLIK